MKIVLNSLAESKGLAKKIAPLLKSGDIIAYRGGMGVGKTSFTAFLLKAMGYDGEVTSPSFSIVHEYTLPHLHVYHYDLYRLSSPEELYGIGFFDYLREKNAIHLIEWSENVEGYLPDDSFVFSFDILGENKRGLEITGGGGRFEDFSN